MKTHASWLLPIFNVAVFSLGLMLGAATIPGCGGGDGDSKSSSKTTAGMKPANNRTPATATGNRNMRKDAVWTDADGRKWFGKIPYDVFIEDAYSVASNTNPIGSSGSKTMAKKEAANPEPKVAAKSGADWASLAPIAILDVEAKRIRNAITMKMQTVGRFNGGYKDVQYEAATLAAIAHVISELDEEISWKDDALFVRDLGTAMNAAADGLGKKKYDATKVAFENFVDIMSRNKPAGLKKPEEGVTFDTFASRGGLMKRMDAAHKYLQKEVVAEDAFKANTEQVTHEATMLALLSKIIADASYESADEEEYQDYAKNMIKASNEMVNAVKVGNFKGYRMAVDKIINNCNDCHTDFKG